MLDLSPYLRRPISTLASIASDPVEAWFRFREQYAASKERRPTPDLYAVQHDWESVLGRQLGFSHDESGDKGILVLVGPKCSGNSRQRGSKPVHRASKDGTTEMRASYAPSGAWFAISSPQT